MQHVAIVGSGVIGLSIACKMVAKYPLCRVTLISGESPLNTTSAVAAAYWAPYWIGTYDKSLASSTLTELQSLCSKHGSSIGMSIVEFREWMDEADAEELAQQLDQAYWWRHLPGIDFKSESLASPIHINIPDRGEFSFTSQVSFKSVVVRMPDYLNYLQKCSLASGRVEIITQWVDQLSDLSSSHDYVINCTGWGAKKLVASDPETARMKILRGHVVRVEAANLPFAISLHRGAFKSRPLYIVPRSGSVQDAICGGTAIEVDGEIDPRLKYPSGETEECEEIYRWCRSFSPEIASGKRCENLTGLRPMRSSLRIEVNDDHANLIHCYGHGGSGLTLSWGSANRVLDLLPPSVSTNQNVYQLPLATDL